MSLILGIVGSKFSEPSLPVTTNLQLWLDAADSSTITLNSGRVSYWDDKSGFNRDVRQTTAGKQPLYSTAVQNGRNVITFDKTRIDSLVDVTRYAISAIAASWDIYVAAKATQATGWFFGIGQNIGGSTGGIPLLFISGTGKLIVEAGSGVGNVTGTTTITNSAKVLRYSFNGTTHTGYINNVSEGSTNNTNARSQQDSDIEIGSLAGGNGLSGDIFEIIVYSSPLNATDSAAVTNYLNTKWGL